MPRSSAAQLPAEPAPGRPATRGDCLGGERPCMQLRCRYNLYTSIRRPPCEPSESCCLDVAERGGVTLAELGAIFGVTREAMRLVEVDALRTFRRRIRFLVEGPG